jgi:dihydrofolate synthase/folylpolyglutamate synthase
MTSQLSDWLLQHYGQEQMRPGLDRIRNALLHLLPTLNQKKIVIIAGTNGKGETSLRLSGFLQDQKHVTWTSPHITRLTERFRSEEGEIAENELEILINKCHGEVSASGISLSYYEFLFLVFCTWAAERNPDYLLLEVGLGGRLDAVNVLDADLVLVPSISRDHQEFLGSRFDQILSEKLGTLRAKTTLIHFLEGQYLKERAFLQAQAVGATVIALAESVRVSPSEFSQRNYLLATAAFCYLRNLPWRPEEWQTPVQPLENRGEILRGQHQWYLSGSHNVDGMRKLIQFLQSGNYNFERPPFDAVIVAFSKRSFHDIKVMIKMLTKAQLGRVLVTTFDHPKAASAVEMEDLAREEGSTFVQDIVSYVQGQNKNQRFLVTGSYYFLGHFKTLSSYH